MRDLRIALLNAAHEADPTRRNFRREVDADLVEFHVPAGQVPETFAFDAAIVTGSKASVYWDEPWIGDLKEWVGAAIETGMPFLGICYGHQLLADVLGGRVEAMGEYELGYKEVDQTGESRLFEGLDDAFTVFTTHSDVVAEVPPGAESLARNDYGNHGFRKEEVFGVQAHPEYDMETAVEVTKGKDLPEERIRSVLANIDEENYAAACEAKTIFENFCDYVREQRLDEATGSEATVRRDARSGGDD